MMPDTVRNRCLPTAVACVLLLWPPSAWPAGAAEWNGSCDIRFLGTSTLHDFSGTVGCQPFTVATATAADGRKVIPRIDVDVLVDEMDTRNATRDRQMRDMFQAGVFPRIHAALAGLDPDRIGREMKANPAGKGTIELTLKIRGVERKVTAAASNLREAGTRVGFDVEFPVSLKAFDLKAPSFLGVVRVGDTVTVAAKVTLEAAQPR